MAHPDNSELAHQVRIVLIGTSHPGNIGASARAMKTMGFGHLTLVQPQGFPGAEATARAAGADDILAAARICDSLAEAVFGCTWVVGASARSRRVEWPALTPREAAGRAAVEASRGAVAVVFGRERSGLKNEELDLCHELIRIPTASDYASLNLAAAVQVLCYELRMALEPAVTAVQAEVQGEVVSHQEMEGFYAHLEQVLMEIGYLDPAAPKLLRRRLRRLFNRTRPDRSELNILRGILSAVQHRR